MSAKDITKAATVEEMVEAYQDACRRVRSAFRLIGEAESRLHGAFTLNGQSYPWVYCDGHETRPIRHDQAEEVIASIRRQAWVAVFDRLELRRFMSIQAVKEWEKEASDNWRNLPELTADNVHAYTQHQLSRVEDYFKEAVVEVFEWLRPWRNTYKTNSLEEIGPRVVLDYVIDRDTFRSKPFPVSYHRTQNLTALENVFSALDGKGNINKRNRSLLQDAIEASSGKGETEYFEFKAFKKGTLHIKFKRLDLLAKLNAMAGGKNLKRRNAA